jgi:FAD-dependent urate hydroxylase
MKKVSVAVIGAGPYGLSVAGHLAARGVDHRIFGRPMQFWDGIAAAGGERYLKSYCFGTNISLPTPGSSFADYSAPRGLETFEPCSIANFAAYGHWFQQRNVGWVEPVDVADVTRSGNAYTLTLENGERLAADRVVVATGLGSFDNMPPALGSLPAAAATHTSKIGNFAAFAGRDVAVVGAGQSALEAAALLREAGARPQLLVRGPSVHWHTRVSRSRSLWRRLRSPISGLGTGPKAWALTRFPGAMHRAPAGWRTSFVRHHLPAEGAWWLRRRVEGQMPIHLATTIVGARETAGRVALRVRSAGCGSERQLTVDHVVAGTGYDINVDRFEFLDMDIRCAIDRIEHAPNLNAVFESSLPGLHFAGPASAMSFGPLFRFVVGADYTARVVTRHLASGTVGAR